MATTVSLSVQKRDISKSAKKLRKEGLVPGVLYGFESDNIGVQVEYQVFRKAFETATYSTIVDLNVEGKVVPVLVHALQFDPIYDTYTHVDFYAINMKKEIHTQIPLHFVGQSLAVKEGGVMNVTKHELHVKCLPTALVHSIEVDITPLVSIGSVLHVSDIQIPEGIHVEDHLEDAVVTVAQPRAEVEEVPLAVEGAEGTIEGAAEGATEGVAEGAEGKEIKPEEGGAKKKPGKSEK